MVNFRSILALLLTVVMTFLLNMGSVEAAKVKKPVTYAPEQLEQIEVYAGDVQALRDRLPELAELIQNQDWTFTRNFIHGPYGELRVVMQNLSRNLLPDAQLDARTLAKTVFDDLVQIDLAAQQGNYKTAMREYGNTVKDFDSFLALVPEAARPQPKPPEPVVEKPALLKLPIFQSEPAEPAAEAVVEPAAEMAPMTDE